MKYLLFGTGEYYRRYKKWFEQEEVVALLDNSSARQGTCIDGIRVFSPQEGVRLEYDAIVVMSFYVKEMKAQLMELGVEEKRIFHFFDLHRLLGTRVSKRLIQYDDNAWPMMEGKKRGKKKILLLSHDMVLGGPALALQQAAEVLKKDGHTVVFASMQDGPLHGSIMEKGIPVVIDENLQIQTMQEAEWIRGFDLLVCNTFVFYVFLSERDTNTPVLWWLHDSSFFYDGVDRKMINEIDTKNLHIVSVGEVPKDAMHRVNPRFEIGTLLYGVSDVCREI